MAQNHLPPQAYTKENFSEALRWYQNQPEHIRALAKSQDELVSLFLRAKRNGADALEALSPSDHQKLKSDLKSIKVAMEQFDMAPTTGSPNSPAQSPSANQPFSTSPRVQTFSMPDAPPSPVIQNATVSATNSSPVSAQVPSPKSFRSLEPNSLHPTPTGSELPKGLDPISLGAIAEVRRKLNLSNDGETLRLLISLGYEKIKPILPS